MLELPLDRVGRVPKYVGLSILFGVSDSGDEASGGDVF